MFNVGVDTSGVPSVRVRVLVVPSSGVTKVTKFPSTIQENMLLDTLLTFSENVTWMVVGDFVSAVNVVLIPSNGVTVDDDNEPLLLFLISPAV